ncbi:AsnC family protein [Amycolatopsis methanolica]|uniref:AsnC family protein n=1 Tax=Amycolatopsis methanolica TaxID=1814 RepID=UPI00341961CC
MAVTDPADARLLAALAELGKVAVHELAARVGMDPREVAYRLVALSGSGLPLLVGVESDPQGLRAALASAFPPAQPQTPNPGPYHAPPSGAVPFAPSGPVPGYPPPAHPPQGVPPARPGGGYPPADPGRTAPPAGALSGPYQVQQGVASGPYQVAGVASGPYPAPLDPVISTWGPPQTASWARGDQRPAPPAGSRTGRIGDSLAGQGLDGEQLTVQLLEVQDPADYLFGAAGYRLEPGERAVVVHTEVTNKGPIPFVSLPDNYLELLTADGKPVGKAPVSLTSRPPHKIGVQPGETAGGHTVYVLPENTRVVAVRWSPRPEPDERSLTWSLED